jgi:hypothetical protein
VEQLPSAWKSSLEGITREQGRRSDILANYQDVMMVKSLGAQIMVCQYFRCGIIARID